MNLLLSDTKIAIGCARICMDGKGRRTVQRRGQDRSEMIVTECLVMVDVILSSGSLGTCQFRTYRGSTHQLEKRGVRRVYTVRKRNESAIQEA